MGFTRERRDERGAGLRPRGSRAGAILGAGALLTGHLPAKTRAILEALGFVLIGIGGVFGFWAFFSQQGGGGLFGFLLASVLIPLAILLYLLKRAAASDVSQSNSEDDQAYGGGEQ